MPEEEEEEELLDQRKSLRLKEINLDDNGLKDKEFSYILEALNK